MEDTTKFIKYLSYVTSPTRISSPFQYRHVVYEGNLNDDLELSLMYFYYDNMFNNDTTTSFCEEMLDFHYKNYNGNLNDFLDFVGHSLDIIIESKVSFPPCFDNCSLWDCLDKSSRESVIRAWIKERRDTERG